MADELKVYTVQDVMRIFGVTRRTVYEWLRYGKIKAFKAGKEWRFTEESIKAFMETGTKTNI